MPIIKRYTSAIGILFISIVISMWLGDFLFLLVCVLFCFYILDDIGPSIFVAVICMVLTIYVTSSNTNLFNLCLYGLYYSLIGFFVSSIKKQSINRKLWSDSQRFLVDSLEHAKDCAAFSFDDHGRIISWNKGAEQIFLYEEKGILGSNWQKLFSGDDIRSGLPEQIVSIVKEKGSWTGEIWRAKKTGEKFWSTDLVIRLKYGYECITRDITSQKSIEENLKKIEEELRRTTEELERKDAQKDNFLATLSHELRNPLQPIKTSLHLYAAGENIDRQTMELFSRNVDQIERLVNDLMDISRINNDKVQLEKSVHDLRELILLAVDQSRSTMKAKNQELYPCLPNKPVYVEGDQGRLQQVFANLLNNAAKYTDEYGSIWITVEEVGNNYQIRVRDNGIGISPELLPKVFDFYTQAEIQRSQGGLGLGLSIAKKLVDLHGGKISAKSEGLGKGSVFIVELPISSVAPKTIIPEQTTFRKSLKDVKMLVVDDNTDAAISLQMLFAMDGSNAQVAYDGEEALQIFKEFAPEIVLLDIGLPKLNGYEVAREIKKINNHAILIAVTGYGQKSDMAKSREAGFDLHVIKPIDPMQFKKLVHQLFISRNSDKNQCFNT